MSSYQQRSLKHNYTQSELKPDQSQPNFLLQNPPQPMRVPDKKPSPLLPPPPVLWAWLAYIYRTTGHWVLPPDTNDTNDQGIVPLESALRNASESDRENNNKSVGITGNSNIASIANIEPFTQNVGFGNKPPDYSLSTSHRPNMDRPIHSTEYSYVNSPYFKEAGRLIELYATRPIEPALLFGCKLVLTLIIAWCQHPLFREMSAREGKWMTLAFERFARELKIRTTNLKIYLNELQATGLLVFDRAGEHKLISAEEFEKLRYDCACLEREREPICLNFFRTRSLQEKNIVYYLKVQPGHSLPEFTPFPKPIQFLPNLSKSLETAGEQRVETEGESGKDLDRSKVDLKRLESNLYLFPSSFPVLSSCNDLNYNNDDVKDFNLKNVKSEGSIKSAVNDQCNNQFIARKEIDNPEKTENEKELPLANHTGSPDFNIKSLREQSDQLTEIIANLNSEQRAKFDFLDKEASFEGFVRSDGRFTLDTPEALKFALLSNLTLEKIKERFDQVTKMWVSRRCRKNPLGLLHWSLTRDCDPGGNSDWKQSNHLYLSYPNHSRKKGRNETTAPTYQNSNRGNSSRSLQTSAYLHSHSAGNLEQISGSEDSFSLTDSSQSVFTNQSKGQETPQFVEQIAGEPGSERIYDPQQCSIIWKKVCTAISDRYKRLDIVQILKTSHLKIESASRKAYLVLEQPWLLSSLLLEEQALIQICFSQEFGSGYKLEIQIE